MKRLPTTPVPIPPWWVFGLEYRGGRSMCWGERCASLSSGGRPPSDRQSILALMRRRIRSVAPICHLEEIYVNMERLIGFITLKDAMAKPQTGSPKTSSHYSFTPYFPHIASFLSTVRHGHYFAFDSHQFPLVPMLIPTLNACTAYSDFS